MTERPARAVTSSSSSATGVDRRHARRRAVRPRSACTSCCAGMSYIGHGLSHAIFGGFAASVAARRQLLRSAPGAWGVASALMINGVTRRRVIGADAAIGVITTASFALGLALFALFGGAGRELRRRALRQHPRRLAERRRGDRRASRSPRRGRASSLPRSCCSRPSTPRSPTSPACAPRASTRCSCSCWPRRSSRRCRCSASRSSPPRWSSRATVARHADRLVRARCCGSSTGIGARCGFVGMNLSYHLDVQSGPTIVLVGAALFALVFVGRAQLAAASAMRQRWTSVRSSNPSRA